MNSDGSRAGAVDAAEPAIHGAPNDVYDSRQNSRSRQLSEASLDENVEFARGDSCDDDDDRSSREGDDMARYREDSIDEYLNTAGENQDNDVKILEQSIKYSPPWTSSRKNSHSDHASADYSGGQSSESFHESRQSRHGSSSSLRQSLPSIVVASGSNSFAKNHLSHNGREAHASSPTRIPRESTARRARQEPSRNNQSCSLM